MQKQNGAELNNKGGRKKIGLGNLGGGTPVRYKSLYAPYYALPEYLLDLLF